jgi:hypothetical protein
MHNHIVLEIMFVLEILNDSKRREFWKKIFKKFVMGRKFVSKVVLRFPGFPPEKLI